MEGTESFETPDKVVETFICDFWAPVCKLTNISSKNNLPFQVEVDRLQRTHCSKTFSEIFQTLLCVTMSKSENSSSKYDLLFKVETDGS